MSEANQDRRWVLGLAGALFVAILMVTWISPDPADTDLSPNTYNSGVLGAKALFLVLPELGYKAERWEDGADALAGVDAARTTLVLAEPVVPETQTEETKGAVASFLERGGRVLVTGAAGAYLLPGGAVKKAGGVYNGLCLTTPEGGGSLAVGSVAMPAAWAWAGAAEKTRVAARCGSDAVVVAYTVGHGEAVWWASALPLTNRGLKEDASLKLALASVGAPGRRVLFDESFHGAVASVLGYGEGAAGAGACGAGGDGGGAAGVELRAAQWAGAGAATGGAELAFGVCGVDGASLSEGRGFGGCYGRGAASSAAVSRGAVYGSGSFAARLSRECPGRCARPVWRGLDAAGRASRPGR